MCVCVWGRQVAICIRLRRLCVYVCVCTLSAGSLLSVEMCVQPWMYPCAAQSQSPPPRSSPLPATPWHLFVLVVVVIIIAVDLVVVVVVALGFSSYHTL